MSLTLVTTAGSASANSYATVAEADAYHDTLTFRTDWPETGSDDDQIKEKALITATRLLDAMYEWAQYVTYPGVQALQWPRIGILRRDRLSYIGSTEIPTELKNATAEFGRQLIAADRSADDDIETKKIRQLTAGSISLSFGEAVKAKVVPDAVVNLLPPWWGYPYGRGRSFVPVMRG